MKSRNIRLNGKDHRQYLIIFKGKTADEDKWLAEGAITDGALQWRRCIPSRRSEQSHELLSYFRQRVGQPVTQTRARAQQPKYHKLMVE
ncbi:hypothetical protein O181_094742 [Austropuccinia psidii MF-1]|uniref:Chromo domain-containing protein n=1 Tax=Austropuccinia psidii MF-1 TaxID=1389203 RepID=A0A9Q3J3H3_9BASI|nr:hypothetical protein [Austropuccinia psidii MF-1]